MTCVDEELLSIEDKRGKSGSLRIIECPSQGNMYSNTSSNMLMW